MNKKAKKSAKKVTNADRTPCEVYSRVVGYLRPVNQWNNGKSSEYSDRKEYKV
ncbi:MAG: anaerobic ribonucleoside-triphosphate reductase [Patescibacteria group bacterium]|jgi:anaerobic ribonucleoside-triphosphate reductase